MRRLAGRVRGAAALAALALAAGGTGPGAETVPLEVTETHDHGDSGRPPAPPQRMLRGTFRGKFLFFRDANRNGACTDVADDEVSLDGAASPLDDVVVLGGETLAVEWGPGEAWVRLGPVPYDADQYRAVAFLNRIRGAAGLPPISRDGALSEACGKHLGYMVQNGLVSGAVGARAHDEELGKPGFTAEGRQAARNADIAFGNGDPRDSADHLLNTFYHRIPLLSPNLERVGIAHSREHRVAILDVLTGAVERPVRRDAVVLYPAPGQQGVPPAFLGKEQPSPVPERGRLRGFPVTATFPKGATVRQARATLAEAAAGPPGPALAAFVSSPESPARADRPGNDDSICLIAEEPLKPRTAYRADLRAIVNGAPWQRAWGFSTGEDNRPETRRVLVEEKVRTIIRELPPEPAPGPGTEPPKRPPDVAPFELPGYTPPR